jgi:crotonobetainyl-CoA:carnitine CoA-transferase CaiB-like acyl-CoA transferase
MEKALEGLKVLGFIQAVAGPFTASILTYFGATVVRIESRTRLEWHRQLGPFVGNKVDPDRASPYLCVNGGQMSLSLNMKHPRAPEVIARLVKWADVVVENFAGGVMKRMGVSYEDLIKIRPDIIMVSESIYGQTGPLSDVSGYGGTLTALTGLPHITGFPDQMPQFPGFAITDYVAPRVAALALVAALDYRRRTGTGQHIDAAQIEAALPLMTPIFLECQANGHQPVRAGNRSTRAAPHGVYPCKGYQRWCVICVNTDQEWSAFSQAIGAPAWTSAQQYATLATRLENSDELDRMVATWTTTKDPQEVMEILQGAGVPAAVVQQGHDLGSDPQLRHRGFYKDLELPGIGNLTFPGMPARLSETPYEIHRAPLLGEHNEKFLVGELGMPQDEYARLKAEGTFE